VLLTLSLFLFLVATVSLGFWGAEKLDRELDAFGYQYTLRIAESNVKTLQFEHDHAIADWKNKISLAEQELQWFERERTGMIEALERQLFQKKLAD
jgi:hypothetical protein